MDEFVKVSSGKKQILTVLDTLEIDEAIEITPNRDGTPDSYFVKKTKNIVINRRAINK